MANTTLLSDADVRSVLDLDEAYAAVHRSFIDRANGAVQSPARIGVGVEDRNAVLLAMPASRGESPALGVKLVTVFPENKAVGGPTIRALYVLFDASDGSTTAVLDAEYLTQIRTAAASAVATKLLATDISSVLIIGTGRQAWGHAHVFARVIGVHEILIAGNSPGRAEALAIQLRSEGLRARTADVAEVTQTRLVVTATSARTPVLRSLDVHPGTHINAVGTFQPDVAELPADLVLRSRVVVDTTDAVLTAGDLAMPIADGRLDAVVVSDELGDVIVHRAVGRRDPSEITIYKSVGASFLDLAVAQLVVDRARARSIGQRFDFSAEHALPVPTARY